MKRLCFLLTTLLLCIAMAVTAFANGIVTDNTVQAYGATYTDYTITGPNSGNTADVHCIEFSPNSGLVPLAYATNGGDVSLLSDHVADAESKGYTVVGAINGSFFSMATGDPCGTLISDGKLVFTHATLTDNLAVFGYDGSFKVIGSCLQFKFLLGGKNVPGGIGLVNKQFSACETFNKNLEGRFHYYDIDAGDLADEAVSGYEIVCEKLNGTDLSVGRTLSAKVLEIKPNTYYGATKITEDNKFVLFLRADSQKFLPRVEELKVGDEVSITPNENDSKFADITKNAQSAIGSANWLVQDGTDKTDVLDTIVHDTDLCRAWTVFGVKEDGTYVYWASSEVDADGENAVSLKDVADAMVAMGCVNVVRLDGGGSTGIYIKDNGAPITTIRPVCDSLLIVKAEELKSKAPVDEPEVSEPAQESTPEASEPAQESTPEVSEPAQESVPEASQPAQSDGNNSDNSGADIGMIICIAAAVIVVIVMIVTIILKKKSKK